ncbi:hypothetical protein CONPUDRAFT_106101 [Coniophora puteana RWD-64-598 SS2]|uniref:NAD(P)-binding protein n=1 Tax=Coniophora puteana (strain RWD-64-598) TaxID=741705 RepID=A0A5M3MKJ0_CONPW|nr:uncharacterized protein CONPUDRAFT_106101 [Coniophora puteana RWD-64-598 SS2]EIW79537.1 hypothetical protein CONPUDRAFT_106101 [Coniophora puteana RWD-64-598 SS2]
MTPEPKTAVGINPVVVVTGANRGVGYGICLRFLRQLCLPAPPDAFLKSDGGAPKELPNSHWLTRVGKVTIVMACRDIDAGSRAREKLVKQFEADVVRHARARSKMGRDGMPEVDVVVRELNLGIASSVFEFLGWLRQTYPHVSHLVCNAAVAPFIGVDNTRVMAQYRNNFAKAFIAPDYLIQRTGETSQDGLGLVWQCNFFGHYMLFRGMHELFSAFAQTSGRQARVVWMSTLASMPEDYSSDDWQLLRTRQPYEGSKYQMQLVRNHFSSGDLDQFEDSRSETTQKTASHSTSEPFHLLVQPGVVATKLDPLNSSGAAAAVRSATLFLCRLFGSTNHTTDPYKGAISAVHAMLVDIPPVLSSAGDTASMYPSLKSNVKLSSKSALMRREYVAVAECSEEWSRSEMEKASGLVEHCDELYQTLLQSFSR